MLARHFKAQGNFIMHVIENISVLTLQYYHEYDTSLGWVVKVAQIFTSMTMMPDEVSI